MVTAGIALIALSILTASWSLSFPPSEPVLTPQALANGAPNTGRVAEGCSAEEVRERRPCRAGGGGERPRVRRGVARGCHPGRPECLDALVVPVDGPPAVVDHRQRTVLMHERDHCRVDVADLGELPRDPDGAVRVDLDDLAPGHEARAMWKSWTVMSRKMPPETRASAERRRFPGRGS